MLSKMEDLSDEQLEIIFEMCDLEAKGFVTSDDLKVFIRMMKYIIALIISILHRVCL